MATALIAIAGLLIGLVAHDLGVQGLRDDLPLRPFRGTCPNCGHHRGWHKWVCPECSRTIGREVVVALATALTAVGFANTVGVGWVLVAFLGFLTLSAALAVSDLDAMRIVDRLNLRGTLVLIVVLGLSAIAVADLDHYWRALGGAAAYFAGVTLLFLVVRGQGFGAGDVKLSVQLGLFTAFVSWSTLGRAAFITAMVGGFLALVLILFGRAGRKTELPYGPAMIIGAWAAIVLSGIGA